jgi:hypothetical protein
MTEYRWVVHVRCLGPYGTAPILVAWFDSDTSVPCALEQIRCFLESPMSAMSMCTTRIPMKGEA